MLLFKTSSVMLLLAIAIIMHVIAVFAKEKCAKIFSYVNIGLHIYMIVPLLTNHFEIKEAVLVYMISFFIYTLLSLLEYRRKEKKQFEVYKIRAEFETRAEKEGGR